MPTWMNAISTLAGAIVLWAVGATLFDAVHWRLHRMLGSRWAFLRFLAWPHSVHHRWLDPHLRIRGEYQTANAWCHLVPEYLTQVAFSAAVWLVYPGAVVILCVLMQTSIFVGLLCYRGLDINHRPRDILDAYQPSWMAVPAYHALHHVFPNAYFSAYGKLVDWIVGTGAQLEGRTFAMRHDASGFGRALRHCLEQAGMTEVDHEAEPRPEGADVTVLCDPGNRERDLVEALLDKAGSRLVPPEVWVIQEREPGQLARFYYRDVRVIYRCVLLTAGDLTDPLRATSAANAVVAGVRRGFNFVPGTIGLHGLLAFRRFRRLSTTPPDGVVRVAARG